jgi:hypothetical protein
MYGLLQAGILTNKLLVKQLAKAGYYQCQFTPGLWQHVWRLITGIMTVGLKQAKHLQAELEKYYECSMDWKGELFCGVHLTRDYKNCKVSLSMPKYAGNALIKFSHTKTDKPQHSPYKAAPVTYGSKQQQLKTKLQPTSCGRLSVLRSRG